MDIMVEHCGKLFTAIQDPQQHQELLSGMKQATLQSLEPLVESHRTVVPIRGI